MCTKYTEIAKGAVYKYFLAAITEEDDSQKLGFKNLKVHVNFLTCRI